MGGVGERLERPEAAAGAQEAESARMQLFSGWAHRAPHGRLRLPDATYRRALNPPWRSERAAHGPLGSCTSGYNPLFQQASPGTRADSSNRRAGPAMHEVSSSARF